MESFSLHPDRPGPPNDHAAGPEHPRADVVDACAQRLERLARRVDAFLDDQWNVIQQVCEELERDAEDQTAWEQQASEFRQQHAEWEESKLQQSERIAEELRALSTAWDQVESERRTLLSDAANFTSEFSTEAAEAIEPIPACTDPMNPANLFEIVTSSSSRSAALQFQQLKREIRQHARRNPS
ncbi:MAG: hypothetical protein KF861_18120 [Planctomycetaceae bacterium]|nr:hypothetical protein [Planctomycetaceae bacterium]